MDNTNTIYSLSSGQIPSGIAVIRFSGPEVRLAFEAMIGFVPVARRAVLAKIRDPHSKQLLDRGIVLHFEAPNSFTGEDCGEFHIHGGPEVVRSVLHSLGSLSGFAVSEPGEFTRRAFENGRLDLTELEGLSDLLAARTRHQHVQAINQSGGSIRALYERWRREIIAIRAKLEAGLDFVEEDDVPGDLAPEFYSQLDQLILSVYQHLDDGKCGEIIRDGYRIVLMGNPNSGKSSLLNALARRDVAIVSPIAGTTRDVIDVDLDLGGYQVTISDTAGIRSGGDQIERLGIDRAKQRADGANLVIWLDPADEPPGKPDFVDDDRLLCVISKVDLVNNLLPDVLGISTISAPGINQLIDVIAERVTKEIGRSESNVLTRARHRQHLESSLKALRCARLQTLDNMELLAEELRLATVGMEHLVGRIDVEDLLDVIFSEFCIGK